MRSVYLNDQKEEIAFVERSAKWFEENPRDVTFTDNGPEAGELIAIRGGDERENIAIVKIDQFRSPVVYKSMIRAKSAENHVERRTAAEWEAGRARAAEIRDVNLWDVGIEIRGPGKPKYLVGFLVESNGVIFEETGWEAPSVCMEITDELYNLLKTKNAEGFNYGPLRLCIKSYR